MKRFFWSWLLRPACGICHGILLFHSLCWASPGVFNHGGRCRFRCDNTSSKIRFITSSYSTNIQLILCQFQWSLIMKSLKHIPPQLVHEPLTSTVAFFQPTFDPHRGAPWRCWTPISSYFVRSWAKTSLQITSSDPMGLPPPKTHLFA